MEIVRSGRWRYADSVEQPVDIVGLPYDSWFALAEADDQLEPGEAPAPPGDDGLLFYVRFSHAGETTTPTRPDSGGHRTVEQAMRAAEERAPTPIVWA